MIGFPRGADRAAFAPWPLVAVASLLFSPSSATAQSRMTGNAPVLMASRQAFSSYWRSKAVYVGGAAGINGKFRGQLQEQALPRQLPWAAASRAKTLARLATGNYVPTPQTTCLPSALPGTGFPPPPYQTAILVESRQVTFLGEVHRPIRIAYFGRQHPAGLKPSWQGDSIARWEGDTLVVDTIGLSDENVLETGIPITTKMHVVQRLRIVNGELEEQATFDDPGAFTGPFTLVTRYERGDPFQEYICAENNVEGGVPTADGGHTQPEVPR